MKTRNNISIPADRAFLFFVIIFLLVCSIMVGINFVEKLGRIKDMHARKMTDIARHLNSIQDELSSLEIAQVGWAKVTLTCYQSVPSQTDSTPHITAINTRCQPGIAAVSRDLLEAGWTFGKKVWIEGHGVYTIEDIMNQRYRNHIDIWVPVDARTFKEESVLAVLING